MRQQLLSRFFGPASSTRRPSPAASGGPSDVSEVVWPPHTTGTSTTGRKRSRSASPEGKSEDTRHPSKSRSKWHSTLLHRLGQDRVQDETQFRTAPYTPLEAQVVELKARYPDVVLLVEVGYRYRFFAEDAHVASRVLGIVAHTDHNFLTASIPTFRLHVHVRRLVEAGYKVGVVRQTETAAIKAHGPNKMGPFCRHLSALYTRATLAAAADPLATDMQDSSAPRYLICIADHAETEAHTGLGVVAVNTATGDVLHGQFRDNVARSKLEALLLTLSPVEYLLAVPASSSTRKLIRRFAGSSKEVRLECVSRDGFDVAAARARLVSLANCHQERVSSGLGGGTFLDLASALPDLVVEALVLAMSYLKQFGLEKLLCHRTAFRPLFEVREMSLPPNVIRQLEILKNSGDGAEKGSLLWLMDHTCSPFGARLLRHWVTHPLCDRHLIEARLDALAEIRDSLRLLPPEGSRTGMKKWSGDASLAPQPCRTPSVNCSGALLACTLISLQRLPDVEQGITRILHGTATAAEFVRVMEAILFFSKQLKKLSNQKTDDGLLDTGGDQAEFPGYLKSGVLQRLVAEASSSIVISHASNLLSLLDVEAAVAGDKLNLFSSTSNRFPEVSRCHVEIKLAEKQMDGFLENFKNLLKMPGLQFTSVPGSSYLIEVPTFQRVPANWLKVNSTKKVSRYHPPEILSSLNKIALAEDQLTSACSRAWELFLADFGAHYADFKAAVHAFATLDCLLALAILSSNQEYVRPQFCDDTEAPQLIIQAGRHPVLDCKLAENFVSNDTFLHAESERCQLITGPNMGGKSCYIRQVALITIMAQIGSFVPAASARLHVLDAIYTRMGASDKIDHGSSTFFEELSETSFILRNASPRSLVIVDELGRGTSTHDGVAISYATLQYLVVKVKCLVLFVTHYPELAGLKSLFPAHIAPFYVSFLRGESDGTNAGQVSLSYSSTSVITFLYKLLPGLANRSFGLHVAQVAQIPSVCVSRATTLAADMEEMSATGVDRAMAFGVLTPDQERSFNAEICSEVASYMHDLQAVLTKHLAAQVTVVFLLSLQVKVRSFFTRESK